jgi:hypothetical protein
MGEKERSGKNSKNERDGECPSKKRAVSIHDIIVEVTVFFNIILTV